MLDLVALLKKMPELPASDLHLRVGTRPVYRVNGKLVRVNLPPVTQEDMERLVHQILTPERLQ